MNQLKETKEELKAQRLEVRAQKLAQKKQAEQQLQLKRHQQKKEAQERQDKYLKDTRKRAEGRKPSRIINTAELIAVRLDEKTVIYIKPGKDPEEAKLKFQERHAAGKQVINKSYNQS